MLRGRKEDAVPMDTMIFNPVHPGEVLRDYLGDMTVGEAASRLGITRAHLSRILNGHAGITAAMSLRLSAALGTSADFKVTGSKGSDSERVPLLIEPETHDLRQFSLLKVERVKVLNSEFEGCGNVQKIRSSSAQFGCGLLGKLAGTFENWVG